MGDRCQECCKAQASAAESLLCGHVHALIGPNSSKARLTFQHEEQQKLHQVHQSPSSNPVHHMIKQRLAWRSGGGRSGRFPGGRSCPSGDPPKVLTSRPYLSSMRAAQGPDLCPGWERAECWPLPWELASAPFPRGDCRRACLLPHCASSSSLQHSLQVGCWHEGCCDDELFQSLGLGLRSRGGVAWARAAGRSVPSLACLHSGTP